MSSWPRVKQLTGLGHAVEMRDPAGFATMRDAGNRLGWTSSWIETVLGECLAVVLAWHGGLVADLTAQVIDEFDAALSASPIPPSSRRAYRARLASLRQLLYETRVVDTAPRRRCGTQPRAALHRGGDGRPDPRRPCCATSRCVRRCCGPSRWNR